MHDNCGIRDLGVGISNYSLIPDPKSRSYVLTFSHPDYTVGSGLPPDPPRPFARQRVAGSPFHRNGLTAGRESTNSDPGCSIPDPGSDIQNRQFVSPCPEGHAMRFSAAML